MESFIAGGVLCRDTGMMVDRVLSYSLGAKER